MTNHPSPFYRFRKLLLSGFLLSWVTAFTLTHIPETGLTHLEVSDKTLHFLGYFLLTSTLLLTLNAFSIAHIKRIISAVLIMALYGAVDELTQPLVNRCAAWSDWFANIAGITAAVIIIELLAYWGRKRNLPARFFHQPL